MEREPRARVRGERADDAWGKLRATLLSSKGRVWLGVGLDVFLTVLLVLLGWSPVLAAVKTHARVAAYVLGCLHVVLVPIVFFLGAKDDVVTASDDRGQSFAEKAVGYSFFGFFVMGWLLPVCAFTIGRVHTVLFAASILVHVSPVILVLVLALAAGIFGKGVDKAADRAFFAIMGAFSVPVLTILFALYLALVEAFLLIVKTRYGDLGRMALPAWAISYLPTRLIFARITGLQGPERWTFAAANVHLLVRLVLTSSPG